MNHLDKQYQELLFDIMENGVKKQDRTGTGTRSVFGRQIRHKMSEGFPLITTKKMYWKGIATELLWFLRGDTNIKFLVDNGVHIRNGDAFKNYIKQTNEYKGNWPDTMDEFIERIKTDFKFAERWGDLGPVYGKQWRKWRGQDGMIGEKDENGTRIITWNQIDQIANLINDLKTNPDSRRLMVTAWNPSELDQMTLPPCHYGFQVYTRELSQRERCEIAQIDIDFSDRIKDYLDEQNIPTRAISLMWNQRSVDVPLGLPFNIASYGLLLEILAKMTNMVADESIGNLGDCHIYENQLAGCREQIPRAPFALPKLYINDEFWATSDDVVEYSLSTEILSMLIEDFQIEAYESHPAIKIPLSN